MNCFCGVCPCPLRVLDTSLILGKAIPKTLTMLIVASLPSLTFIVAGISYIMTDVLVSGLVQGNADLTEKLFKAV